MYYIRKYLEISNGNISVNGRLCFRSSETDFGSIMKEFYKNLDISYPKFYKMDDLCKLAFIGSEIMLDGIKGKNIALLFSNSESSLEDRKSTRLNSSHVRISYAVFCLKKKKQK